MGHPKEMLVGFQTEVVGYQGKEQVKMYSGSEIAPGFFAWVIPSEMIRIELAFGRADYLMDGQFLIVGNCSSTLWKDRLRSFIIQTARYWPSPIRNDQTVQRTGNGHR